MYLRIQILPIGVRCMQNPIEQWKLLKKRRRSNAAELEKSQQILEN